MKDKKRFTATQRISLLLIIASLLFTFLNLYQNTKLVDTETNNHIESLLQEFSLMHKDQVDDHIQSKISKINLINSNLKRIKNKDDAALFLDPWMATSNYFFEYAKYSLDENQQLKRHFSFYNDRFLSNIDPKDRKAYQQDASGLLKFISTRTDREYIFQILVDDNKNKRLLILKRQPSSPHYHLFKFSIDHLFKQTPLFKINILNSDNIIKKDLEPFHKLLIEKFTQKTLVYQFKNSLGPNINWKLTKYSVLIFFVILPILILFTFKIYLPLDDEKRGIHNNLIEGEIPPLTREFKDPLLTPIFEQISTILMQKNSELSNKQSNIRAIKKHSESKEKLNQEYASVLHTIFSALELGFFVFDQDGRITNLYNKYFQNLIRKNPLHLDFLELFLDTDRTSWLRNLFSKDYSFEDLQKVAPYKINKESLTKDIDFKVYYHPIYDHNNNLIEVLCVLQDETKEVQLAQSIDHDQRNIRTILAINESPKLFQLLMNNLIHSQKEIQAAELKYGSESPSFVNWVQSEYEIILPNLKMYHFQDFVKEHEDFLNGLASNQLSSIPLIDSINTFFEELFVKINSFSPFTNIVPFDENPIIFDVRKNILSNKTFHPNDFNIHDIMNMYERTSHLISEELGKKVSSFIIKTDLKNINLNKLEYFFYLLNNVYINTIKHANEIPAIREKTGKSPGINIETIINKSEDSLIISIKDDGLGIDPETIRNHFSERENTDYITQKSDEDILLHIFDDEFGSINGFGLSRVRYIINILNGSYSVRSKKGQHTTFEFKIPIS